MYYMKNKLLSTWLGTGALVLSLAVMSLPASAQTTAVPGTSRDTVTTTSDNNRDDGFDWGWLGLLGLIGLVGLKGRDRDTHNSYSDRASTAPSTSTNPRY